jgi:DNA-binding response OmpR family regulator
VSVYLEGREVILGKRSVGLTKRQAEMMAVLLKYKNKPVPWKMFYAEVYPDGDVPAPDTIIKQVSALRGLLRQTPMHLYYYHADGVALLVEEAA